MSKQAEQAIGTWKVGDTTEADIYIWGYRDSRDTEGVLIATLNGDDYASPAEQVAAAYKIAAVNDLLAACEALLDIDVKADHPQTLAKIRRDAQAAIAKARSTP